MVEKVRAIVCLSLDPSIATMIFRALFINSPYKIEAGTYTENTLGSLRLLITSGTGYSASPAGNKSSCADGSLTGFDDHVEDVADKDGLASANWTGAGVEYIGPGLGRLGEWSSSNRSTLLTPYVNDGDWRSWPKYAGGTDGSIDGNVPPGTDTAESSLF